MTTQFSSSLLLEFNLPPSKSSTPAMTSYCEHTKYNPSISTRVTLEDLQHFHFYERELFKMLVIQFARDPAESLLIMALWLCLEKMHYVPLTIRVIDHSQSMLIGMAREAVSCIRFLESDVDHPLPTPPDGGLPLTSRLLNTYISLRTFLISKYTIISHMKDQLHTTCSKIFTDILISVLRTRPNPKPNQLLRIRGFPHPIFGELRIMNKPLDYVFPDERPCIWSTALFIAAEDRTIFLTFSRGFPVTEEEVRQFFTLSFGDFIESIHMGIVPSTVDQSLYAMMVLYSVEGVDKILRGRRTAKFRVNEKHVWARKFEPKN